LVLYTCLNFRDYWLLVIGYLVIGLLGYWVIGLLVIYLYAIMLSI
jgi:hypothetical protein